eukprot:CAMPEP_0119008452 /NCGR_PEP_ID=MMETSP1176-20130426/3703_1 /TAXON_ID=265551 /ORGANISM="Synedropsis recta cf, Strain CCMP1620" /LENGTH=453 /DNA_ID=CAMNT_0006960783 /DNA_START=108 /DNA_END=1469 /DNA_ORIENTATION=-
MRAESAPLSSPSTNRCNFGWMIKYVNFTAIAVLAVLVGIMFVQLQYVTYQVNQDKKVIAALSDQVNTQQQDQIETLDQKITTNESLTIFQMAGTFVLLTCLITMFHMTSHLQNYNEPVVQRKVIAILWMSPIYAVTSFLSLVVPVLEGYLSIIKDFYEAYVIYTFLSFLIAVLGRGDRSVAVQTLAKHADHLKNPTSWFKRLYHPPPEESATAKANAVLLECQILAMQFVFCRPLTSVASFVVTTLMIKDDDDATSTRNDDGGDTAEQVQKYFTSPQFWISMVQNVSVFLAFAGLLKFYHAVSADLSWIQPFSKFLCIKGVVFMTFWQGLIINIIVSLHAGGRWEDSSDEDPREKALALQNVLICLEMLFFSIAHWCVFPTEEWQDGFIRRDMPNPGIGFTDFVSDVSIVLESGKNARRQRRIQDGKYVQAVGDENDDIEQPADPLKPEAQIT